MKRWRLSLLAALCVIVPASPAARSAPVRSERSGLEQVPATTPIIVHLRGVQGTRDRLVTMMQNALPDVLKKFQPQMDDFLQNGYMGRKLDGLVKDGPIFFVLTELPKPGAPADPPPLAFLVAVSDYKKFRDGLMNEEERKNIKDNGKGVESAKVDNDTLYFVDRKGYAVVTPSEEVANSFTQKQPSIQLSKTLADKLMNSDLGVYVNMSMVNQTYGEQMKEMKKQIDQSLAPLAAIGDETQKKMVEGFQKAIGPVFQAVEDSQAVLFTVDLRPGGLALHMQSEVRGETPTASLLVDSRPVDFQELERLPDGRTYYSGLKTSAALYKGIGNLISSFTPTGESKGAAAGMEELAKAGPSVRLDSYSFPLEGVQVYHYVDPARAVAAQLKIYEAMGDNKNSGVKGKPVIKKDAETYGDFKLHSVQATWDLDKMAEGAAARGGDDAKKQVADALKGILGEKMNIWIGTDGKTVVQVNAKDWASAKKLLDQYTKGNGTVGEVKAFRDVRKEMPPKTSYLGLIDAVHMTGTMVEVFRPFMGGAPIPPGWPNMPPRGTMTFVGLAVTLQPKSGSFDLFISAAAAREFYKAVVKPFVNE